MNILQSYDNQTEGYQNKNKPVDQQNGIINPESPDLWVANVQQISYTHEVRKENHSNKRCWEKWRATCKKMKWNCISCHLKMNQRSLDYAMQGAEAQ